MVVSFLISQLLIGEIFIGKTSRIRLHLGQYVLSKLGGLFTFKNPFNLKTSQDFMPVLTGTPSEMSFNQINPDESPKELLKDIPLNPAGRGIYTKENAHVNYLLIKEQEVDWKNSEFELNGKKEQILVPSGEQSKN